MSRERIGDLAIALYHREVAKDAEAKRNQQQRTGGRANRAEERAFIAARTELREAIESHLEAS